MIQRSTLVKGKKGAEDSDGDTFFKRLTVNEKSLLSRDPSLVADPDLLFAAIKQMKKVNVSKTAPLNDKVS